MTRDDIVTIHLRHQLDLPDLRERAEVAFLNIFDEEGEAVEILSIEIESAEERDDDTDLDKN